MGLFELAIIAALVAVFFGAGRIPEAMGAMGKSVKAFKEGAANPDGEPSRDDEPPRT